MPQTTQVQNGHTVCVTYNMSAKELSDQLVGYAINLALYSLPGDKDAREAYKILATDLLLQQPRQQFNRMIPSRLKIKCKRNRVLTN